MAVATPCGLDFAEQIVWIDELGAPLGLIQSPADARAPRSASEQVFKSAAFRVSSVHGSRRLMQRVKGGLDDLVERVPMARLHFATGDRFGGFGDGDVEVWRCRAWADLTAASAAASKPSRPHSRTARQCLTVKNVRPRAMMITTHDGAGPK